MEAKIESVTVLLRVDPFRYPVRCLRCGFIFMRDREIPRYCAACGSYLLFNSAIEGVSIEEYRADREISEGAFSLPDHKRI